MRRPRHLRNRSPNAVPNTHVIESSTKASEVSMWSSLTFDTSGSTQLAGASLSMEGLELAWHGHYFIWAIAP